MGKKVKVGKSRKDKFYQLAKEAGYRSRAAFKLLQLNRTYHFLEKSRVCIDLCAAPGGWLQVAATHMPLSSLIIGVDLAPIKPIANVITHIEDITTDKCRSTLKKDLVDNKADIVLHDGAPNVGKNWLHDAYQQNMLVLQSFKLATEFLKKGGTFVTKIFRSKDYYAVMWVFQQFFKKVDSTKPQASRNESAEIFLVCQNYLAPEKIDPKFFDIKFVFSEVDNQNDNKRAVDLFKENANQRNRGGYPEGDLTLYHKLKASEFLQSENFIDLLAKSNMIELDDERIIDHPATTSEIKNCLTDLKLLGKSDLKNLLKWRIKLKTDLYQEKETIKPMVDKNKKEKQQEDNESTDEDEKIKNEIEEALIAEKKIDKRKKKKIQKEKQKLKEKLKFKMTFANDIVDHDAQGDNEIFSLNKIKTKKQLLELQSAIPGLEISDDEVETPKLRTKQKVTFSKFDAKNEDEFDRDDDQIENHEDPEFEKDSDLEEINEYSGSEDEANPLLTNLNETDKKESKSNTWFNKDAFDFLNNSDEHNKEILDEIEMDEENETNVEKKKVKSKFDSDSDSDESEEESNDEKTDEFLPKSDENKENLTDPKKRKLSTEELAIGEMIVNSKKTKRDLMDDSYNRYSRFDDEQDLPKWFIEDEQKNFKKDVSIPRKVFSEYKKKSEDINARPIKKVVEAQARKKKRMWKKTESARKKAEAVSDNTDMTDKERAQQVKSIYKKAGLLAKKKLDVKYIVAKKGLRGKALAKSKGVKGPYKVVDKRLKKDRAGQAKLQKNRMMRKQMKSKQNKLKKKAK